MATTRICKPRDAPIFNGMTNGYIMKINLKQALKGLLQKADRQDKALSQTKRKVKWTAILGTLFTFYVLSFLQPRWALEHVSIGTSMAIALQDSASEDSTHLPVSPFELPVDSFEQLLNQHIHENTD